MYSVFIASEGRATVINILAMGYGVRIFAQFVVQYSSGARHEIDFKVLLSFGVTPLLSPLNNTNICV
jgi:hypothetical protein